MCSWILRILRRMQNATILQSWCWRGPRYGPRPAGWHRADSPLCTVSVALLRGPARRRGADDGILGGRNSAKTLPLEGIPSQGAGVGNLPRPMKTEPFCLPRPHRTPLLWAMSALLLADIRHLNVFVMSLRIKVMFVKDHGSFPASSFHRRIGPQEK